MYVYIDISMYQYIYLSIYLCIFLSIYLYIYLLALERREFDRVGEARQVGSPNAQLSRPLDGRLQVHFIYLYTSTHLSIYIYLLALERRELDRVGEARQVGAPNAQLSRPLDGRLQVHFELRPCERVRELVQRLWCDGP